MKRANFSSDMRPAKSARINANGDKEFIYGVQDKASWSSFLDQVAAQFLTAKISYLLDEVELARRKLEPGEAGLIIPGDSESSEEEFERKRLQRFRDDIAKCKMAEHIQGFHQGIPCAFRRSHRDNFEKCFKINKR